LTFYQTIKGITAAQHVVKPGGKVLVMGECTEGIGSPEFSHLLNEYGGAREFLEAIAETPVVPDQWQLEKLALVALKHPLLFYVPGAKPERLGALGSACFGSAAEAVTALLEGLPAGARVAVIPEGPYAFARVEARELAGV
jgi:nickel-dependent lactate racemase